MELIGRFKKILVSIMALIILAGANLLVNQVDVKAAEKIQSEKIENKTNNTNGVITTKGIEWPKQVNAPFIDMAAWVTKAEYSNNGAPNLARISKDSGVKFFNLGFIQSAGGKIQGNKLARGWGGYEVLSEASPDNAQYQGIKKSIKEVREMGGDVVVTLGGLNGMAFWEATQNVDVLANTYMDLITTYDLTRLGLDIEGPAQNKQKNIANAKAIKKVQDKTGVKIILTVPVLPSGLTQEGLGVLEAYLTEGVDIEIVNIMTMCYGTGTLLPGENYGTASLRAVDNTKDQLKEYYKRFAGKSLTDKEAYAKIGTTPSIGFEGAAHPIFGTDWARLVVDHAIKRGLGMTSFWSMNRDAMLENNQGVSSQYEFTGIFKDFGTNDISGVADESVETVDKTVDIVEDVVNENKEQENLNNTYNPSKQYNAGDKVLYNGKEYKAKWWTQGEVPDKADVWEIVVEKNPDGSQDYVQGKVYIAGDIVRYQDKNYKAKWWTTSIPGSDDSWQKI